MMRMLMGAGGGARGVGRAGSGMKAPKPVQRRSCNSSSDKRQQKKEDLKKSLLDSDDDGMDMEDVGC